MYEFERKHFFSAIALMSLTIEFHNLVKILNAANQRPTGLFDVPSCSLILVVSSVKKYSETIFFCWTAFKIVKTFPLEGPRSPILDGFIIIFIILLFHFRLLLVLLLLFLLLLFLHLLLLLSVSIFLFLFSFPFSWTFRFDWSQPVPLSGEKVDDVTHWTEEQRTTFFFYVLFFFKFLLSFRFFFFSDLLFAIHCFSDGICSSFPSGSVFFARSFSKDSPSVSEVIRSRYRRVDPVFTEFLVERTRINGRRCHPQSIAKNRKAARGILTIKIELFHHLITGRKSSVLLHYGPQ